MASSTWWRERDSKKYALKRVLVSVKEHERIHREVEVLRALDRHPGLVQLVDVRDRRGILDMVMEYASGGDVEEWMKKGNRVPAPEFLQFATHLLEALAHLHEQRIIHRDIKPANILLGDSGRPMLADFGVSRFVQTRSGKYTQAGTTQYMAPEVTLREAYSVAADVWSLGATLWHIACGGGRLFCSAADVQLATGGTGWNMPPIPSEYPAEATRLLRRMLVVDSHRRPSAAELLREIAAPAVDAAYAFTPNPPASLVSAATTAAAVVRSRELFSARMRLGSIATLSLVGDSHLAVGEGENIRVHDLKTGGAVTCLAGHTSSVQCVTVLPNNCLISGGEDSRVCVWDLRSGKCIQTVDLRSGTIHSIAALFDGRVAVGRSDGSILLWNALGTGPPSHTLRGHRGSVRGLATLPDGRLVSASTDTELRVWSLADARCVETLAGHSGTVFCVAALTDGRIASGSWDKKILVWDIRHSGSPPIPLQGHDGAVFCAAELTDRRLVSGSWDKTVRVWGSAPPLTLRGHADEVRAIAALPNNRVASGSADGALRVWGVS